jgi:hypothetical protein
MNALAARQAKKPRRKIMSDAKPVLLARPHPFIVAEMLPLLAQSGYVTSKLERLADLPLKAKNARGAVISLALASSIAEPPEDVFAKLRRSAPAMPVVFAALLDFTLASRKLDEIARQAGVKATVLGVEKNTDGSGALGKPATFLYVGKDDLVSTERRALTMRLIQQHFG